MTRLYLGALAEIGEVFHRGKCAKMADFVPFLPAETMADDQSGRVSVRLKR